MDDLMEAVVWIQPNHLQKARQSPFLCRVEPTQRIADFTPLFTADQMREYAEQARKDYSFTHAQTWLKRIDDAVQAEREAIATEFERRHEAVKHRNNYWLHAANHIRARSQREHVTDGNPCWCNPETTYTDPDTGASVIVHKEPQ